MQITINTNQPREVIDLTKEIQSHVPSSHSGAVIATVLHTTATVTTADLDPGTDQDLLDFLAAVIPDLHWRHPHDPFHAPDHLLASVIGPSVTLPVQKGKLVLGQWQRIILIEFNGPRERNLDITLIKGS